MKRLLITIGAACTITASASAQGFTPESVRDFFHKKSPAAKRDAGPNAVEELLLVELWGKAAQFRQLAVDKPKLDAWKRSALVRPGALERLEQGKITRAYRELWSWVLMGSQPILGNTLGDSPVVAFYNPFIDAALLTTWTHVDDKGWKMADAVPVTGAAFIARRASRAGDRAGYGKAAGNFDDKLVANRQRFVASFEAQYPPFGRASRALPTDAAGVLGALSNIEDSSYTFIGWLRDSVDEDAPLNYAKMLRYFLQTLGADSPADLAELIEPNVVSAAEFFKIAQPVRRRMMPYLAVPGTVLFVDPASANGFIALRIERHEAPPNPYRTSVQSAIYRTFSK